MATKSGIRTMGRPPTPIAKRAPPRSKSTKPLTPQQRLFLETYLTCLNSTRAYQRAYPRASWAAANSAGSRLLKDVRVGSEVRARVAAATARYRPKADNVLHELASLAFSNIADAVDADNRVLPIHDMPVRTQRAIKKLKSREERDPKTKEVIAELKEVEMADKLMPLKLLGMEDGMFADQHDVNVNVSFQAILEKAAERLIESE